MRKLLQIALIIMMGSVLGTMLVLLASAPASGQVKPVPPVLTKAKVTTVSLPELSDLDSARVQLAVEKSSHANDNFNVVFTLWRQQPEVKAMIDASNADAQAVTDMAAALMKQYKLDPARYQLDVDAAGKPPHPKFALRPEAGSETKK
jgi:hypothetical protein